MSQIINIQEAIDIEVLKPYTRRIFTHTGTKYYKIPFWLEVTEDGLVLHTKLPEDLQHHIVRTRLGDPDYIIREPDART